MFITVKWVIALLVIYGIAALIWQITYYNDSNSNNDYKFIITVGFWTLYLLSIFGIISVYLITH